MNARVQNLLDRAKTINGASRAVPLQMQKAEEVVIGRAPIKNAPQQDTARQPPRRGQEARLQAPPAPAGLAIPPAGLAIPSKPWAGLAIPSKPWAGHQLQQMLQVFIDFRRSERTCFRELHEEDECTRLLVSVQNTSLGQPVASGLSSFW